MVTGKATRLPMPGLAESGWPGCIRSDGGGGVISGWNASGLPIHRSGSSGWAWATAAPPLMNTFSIPPMSGANSDD